MRSVARLQPPLYPKVKILVYFFYLGTTKTLAIAEKSQCENLAISYIGWISTHNICLNQSSIPIQKLISDC